VTELDVTLPDAGRSMSTTREIRTATPSFSDTEGHVTLLAHRVPDVHEWQLARF